MPLYEYTCQACRSDFELLLRGEERPACPDCGGAKLEKRFSVPAAHTKGSSLPIASPGMGGGCGAPACGMGRCQFDG